MKKILTIILALAVCLSLLTVTALAAAPTAKLSGPGSVRAGDTLTVNYLLKGEDIVAVKGTLKYNSAQLTLVSAEQKIGGNWLISSNGNTYMAEDNNLTSPIRGEATLFSFTFKVASLAEGTEITVGFENVSASSLSQEYTVTNTSYKVTVSRPLASNSNLGALTIGNATLSPAFDPSLTRYSVEVPFEVTHLDVQAAAADSNASVAYYNPVLEADRTTTITVTVTAENGSTKEYVILAKRGKDPNYVPGNNNNLNNIVVEEFRLSPVFDPRVTNYLIWLPYEVDSVKITGIAEDDYATITVEGGSELIAGADNEVKVTCTAENGDAKVYTIIVKRAPAHEDINKPTIPSASTVPSTAPTATGSLNSSTQSTRPTNSDQNVDIDAQRDTLLVIMYSALGLLSAAGIAVCVLFVIASRKEGKFSAKHGKVEEADMDPDEEEEIDE